MLARTEFRKAWMFQVNPHKPSGTDWQEAANCQWPRPALSRTYRTYRGWHDTSEKPVPVCSVFAIRIVFSYEEEQLTIVHPQQLVSPVLIQMQYMNPRVLVSQFLKPRASKWFLWCIEHTFNCCRLPLITYLRETETIIWHCKPSHMIHSIVSHKLISVPFFVLL